MAHTLLSENVWLQQQKFEDAERLYRQLQAGTSTATSCDASKSKGSALATELAQVRQDIHKALNKPPVGAGAGDSSVYQRLDALERENKELKKVTDELRSLVLNIQSSIGMGNTKAATSSSAKPAAPAPAKDDDDEEFDLFDDDEEDDTAAQALREKRVNEYNDKKSKKPALIAKSSVMLEVKPWDDETDMKKVEVNVRKITMDGLVWGTGKLVEVGYGIKKLVILCVVEDDKVSIDDLQEKICEDEDNVQSVDIGAFNKI